MSVLFSQSIDCFNVNLTHWFIHSAGPHWSSNKQTDLYAAESRFSYVYKTFSATYLTQLSLKC